MLRSHRVQALVSLELLAHLAATLCLHRVRALVGLTGPARPGAPLRLHHVQAVMRPRLRPLHRVRALVMGTT